MWIFPYYSLNRMKAGSVPALLTIRSPGTSTLLSREQLLS